MLHTVHSSSNRLGRPFCYDTQEHCRRNFRASLDGHSRSVTVRFEVAIIHTPTQTPDTSDSTYNKRASRNTTMCYCTLDLHDNSSTFFFCFCYSLLASAAAASAFILLMRTRCGQGIYEISLPACRNSTTGTGLLRNVCSNGTPFLIKWLA